MRVRLRWPVIVVFCVCVAGCGKTGAAPVSPAAGAEVVLKPGPWGSPMAVLEITEGEAATLELVCAHGTITGPLIVGDDGKVDWPGQFIRERGGAVPEGAGAEGEMLAVRYRGTVRGDTLTVDIVTGGRVVYGPLTLTRGKRFRVPKCP